MPCGALSEDKNEWHFPKKRDFIFPEEPLMKLFRGKFNETVWRLPGAEKINRNTFRTDYVVNIKCVDDGGNAFKYLAAYTQRGFLGNDRIVKYDGHDVTFAYRESATHAICHRTLPAVEFMQLYLRHVLPKGIQRIRYGGIWAAAARKSLNAAKEILGPMKTQASSLVLVSMAARSFIRDMQYRCPKCGAVMEHRTFRRDSG